jgi:peptide deformylase
MKLITDKLKNGLTNPEFTKYLKTPVVKSQFTTQEADDLQKILSDKLNELGGLGLSATQIGINKRACIIKVEDEEIFLLNPIITYRDQEGFIFYEGCLSIPKTLDIPIRTIRHTKVKVQTDNLGELEFEINKKEDSKEDRVSPDTLRTVVVQHEIDHLDGITIKDRVYSTTVKRNVSYGRNDKIIMKSPEGDMIEVKYKKANDYFLNGYEIV